MVIHKEPMVRDVRCCFFHCDFKKDTNACAPGRIWKAPWNMMSWFTAHLTSVITTTHTLFHCWAFHKGRLSCHLQADNDPLGCAASESHISRSGCAHGNSILNNDFQWWLFHEWFPWSSNHVQFFTRVRMVRMYNQTPEISMIVCFSRCSWVPWMKKGCKSW